MSKPYERRRELAAQGIYDLILPLDYKILEQLPEEGTMVADLYPLGETIQNLKKKFPEMPGDQVFSARIRSMEAQGLTLKVRAVGNSGAGSRNNAWQRTKTASALLAKWKAGNDND